MAAGASNSVAYSAVFAFSLQFSFATCSPFGAKETSQGDTSIQKVDKDLGPNLMTFWGVVPILKPVILTLSDPKQVSQLPMRYEGIYLDVDPTTIVSGRGLQHLQK